MSPRIEEVPWQTKNSQPSAQSWTLSHQFVSKCSNVTLWGTTSPRPGPTVRRKWTSERIENIENIWKYNIVQSICRVLRHHLQQQVSSQNDFHCFHCPLMNWAKYRMPGCTWSSSEPSRFMVTPPKAATKTESYMSILANKRCPQSFETSK